MSLARTRILIPALFISTAVGCSTTDPDEAALEDAVVSNPIAAFCQVYVAGVGTIGMEDNYLPHVIACENGGANLEALKAQAIAARSVAYHEMNKDGSICDSQNCQVYSCGVQPSAIHYQAVNETSGMYMSYNNNITYAFYVDGDHNTAPPSCVGNPWAPREQYVTYNQGRTGYNVEQSTLGWVVPIGSSAYGQNRGGMSQWGARCLENNKGYDYRDILEFYYGADIGIYQAYGTCVGDVDPGGCSCDQGIYHNGDPIPPSQTFCGMRVCGLDDNIYECTSGGWSSVAGLSCGQNQCSCAQGIDYKGNPIDPAHTECNVRTCGLDNQFYDCQGAGWTPTGESCPIGDDASDCRCENGYDGNGNPIDPDSTFCGFETCGVNGQQWRCVSSGWSLVSSTCNL